MPAPSAVVHIYRGRRSGPKVTSDGGADTRFAYYSVDVNPLLEAASIRYELPPTLYYLNL